MNPIPCILSALSLLASGYLIGQADRVSEAWKLSHGCRAIAWAQGEILSTGMVFVHEGRPRYLCENGVLK